MKLNTLFALALLVLMLVGWVLNVHRFIQCDFEAPYQCEVIRVVGIPVTPLGAVVGWMDLGK